MTAPGGRQLFSAHALHRIVCRLGFLPTVAEEAALARHIEARGTIIIGVKHRSEIHYTILRGKLLRFIFFRPQGRVLTAMPGNHKSLKVDRHWRSENYGPGPRKKKTARRRFMK